MKLSEIKAKGAGAFSSLICAVLSVICLAAYVIYGVTYDYLDAAVALTIVLGAALALFHSLAGEKALGLLNLLSSMSLSYAVGLFFVNSHPVWADRLNNITMYGARGGLEPVILITVLLALAILAVIVSCFSDKGGEKA